MLRITVDGSMVAMNLRKRIPAAAWSTKTGMPCGKSVEAQDISLYLETIRNKAFQFFTELSREYDEVTPEQIRDHLQGLKGGTARSLMTIWEEHNLELKMAIGCKIRVKLYHSFRGKLYQSVRGKLYHCFRAVGATKSAANCTTC